MKFLVDANLPPGLVAWLREHNHEAIHVNDQLGIALDDRSIFEFARRNGFIIVSKDEDFATLAMLGDKPASVVWIRFGNATNAKLRDLLEPLLSEIVQRLAAGETLIEVV
jgi:predicted nuclease of predicted toxin-antitoxin system